MAPLSRDRTTIQQVSSNRTTDTELEKKNFDAAGEILPSVWFETGIENYLVVAKWSYPAETPIDPYHLPVSWEFLKPLP